jgi:tetratricopeptide (TPR) repeat protein
MRLLSIVAVAGCALLPLPAFAQDWKGGTGRLEGRVMDQDGKPIENASVKLDLPGRGGTELKTDKKGHWAYLGLTDGTWNVDMSAPGYVTKRISAPVSADQRIPPIDIKLQKAVPQGPSPEEVALKQADSDFQAGKYAEARANYEKLLPVLPNQAAAIQMRIARCYKGEGNVPAEIEHLQTVASQTPDNAEIYSLIAQEALQAHLTDKADEALKKIDDASIKDPNVFFNIGVGYLNAGRAEDAVTYFTKSVTLDPNYADGYFQRGLTYLGLQKFAECKADLQKFLALQPDSPQAETAKKALASIK